MGRLATVPHAKIVVVNRRTGVTETREPGSWFGLAQVTGLTIEGRTLIVDLGANWQWRFQCTDVAEAERHCKDLAIRVGRS